MSQTYELEAVTRDRVGKGAARALRRNGKVPAVIYGDKQPPIPIALPYKETFQRLHSGGFLTTLADIKVGDEKIRVIPRDFQLDPVRDFLVHIDFLRIGKGARLTLEIPCQFINEEESPGITRGGALNVVRYTVELECPADNIPEAIVCDLTGMDIGDSLHISAIDLPEGVEPTIKDRDFTIVTIAASAGMQEEMAAEAEAAEAEAELLGEVPEGEEAGEEQGGDGDAEE